MEIGEKELIMLRAIHHVKHEEFDKALACIQGIIDEDPDDNTAWFNKAHTLRIAGRTIEAREILIQIIESYPDRADILFEMGLVEKDFQNFDGAADYFAQCIHYNPLLSEPRVELGFLNYHKSNFDSAKQFLEDALVFNPENTLVMNHLGLIAQRKENYEEAERWFRESSEHNPADSETWYNLARLYEEQGKRYEEISCYDKLISLYPEQIVPWLKKGLCYLITDELLKSLACFRMASRLDYDNHLAYLLTGLVYSILDQNEEAVLSLEKAASLSDEPEVMVQYGRALGACFRYEKALTVFSDMLIKYPDNRAAAEGYARALYLLRRYDDVQTFCTMQRSKDPENPFWITTYARVTGWHLSDPGGAINALREGMNTIHGLQIPIVLADLLVHCDQPEEALSVLHSLEHDNPGDYQVLSRLSSLLAQMKLFDQAAVYFDMLIKIRPQDMSIIYLAGQAHEQAGNSDRALELYTIALTGNPENAEIWLSRGRVLIELGQYHDAATNAAQAADLNPGLFDASFLKGMAEFLSAQYEKARISLTLATTLDPDNGEVWSFLGDTLIHSGDKPAAKLCYERALALDPGDVRAINGLQEFSTKNNNMFPGNEESISDENS